VLRMKCMYVCVVFSYDVFWKGSLYCSICTNLLYEKHIRVLWKYIKFISWKGREREKERKRKIIKLILEIYKIYKLERTRKRERERSQNLFILEIYLIFVIYILHLYHSICITDTFTLARNRTTISEYSVLSIEFYGNGCIVQCLRFIYRGALIEF